MGKKHCIPRLGLLCTAVANDVVQFYWIIFANQQLLLQCHTVKRYLLLTDIIKQNDIKGKTTQLSFEWSLIGNRKKNIFPPS